ncbi:hypothetical protein CPB86DRAFT_820410 [Serendipita vermifera]|nr:hypothetical protein CPB86DRAFT_820410 [Serendipita vermifera]
MVQQILHAYVRKNVFPHLNYAIRTAISKLDKYIEVACQNPCYGIAMFLNPASKLSWISKHWSRSEQDTCIGQVKSAMLAFLRAERDLKQKHQPNSSPQLTKPLNPSGRASHNLGNGFQSLQNLFNALDKDTDDNNCPSIEEDARMEAEE